jgi:HK97 family phage major capsid protein
MSLSIPEARSEIKNLLEQAEAIEKRYDGEITDHEDQEQVKALLSTVDELETKLGQLESADERKRRIQDGLEKYSSPLKPRFGMQNGEQKDGEMFSPGVQFVNSSEYRQLSRDGAFNSELSKAQFGVGLKDGTSLLQWKQLMQQEAKALLRAGSTTSGGAFVLPSYQGGVVDILQRDITFLDLVPRIQTSSDTISYMRQDTYTIAATAVAEATATTGTTGLKPESTLAYSRQTSTVKTIAHWIPVTNRMLDDAPAIRGIIDSQLLLGLEITLENQVLAGSGTGEDLTGLLNAGINTLGLGSFSVLDALLRARTIVRVTGHGRPNAVVLNPLDFEAIRTARENVATATLGQYLMAPPYVAGPMSVWGMVVTESEAMTENTGVVGDFAQGMTLFDREQSAIRVGLIDDQFVRNMQTILAEGRWALVVQRPTVFTRVTGI